MKLLWLAPLLALAVTPSPSTAGDLRVDTSKVVGTIRPLHGVNGGPLNYGETIDLTRHWKEAGIPNARLHDCEWPSGRVVDFHSIVPDLSADLSRPESYRFEQTDDYLKGVTGATPGVVFRLGESIEHTKRKYYVHPPKDYDRWAEACRGIIRHYNRGWADGHRHNIRYWEIWNEPENRPAMWTGTEADYYRLYRTAAKAIKDEFPEVKVGGPAVGATGDVVDGRWRSNGFLDGFLNEAAPEGVPLDFFSWHTYSDDPTVFALKARGIRAWLDEHGRRDAEIHLNEWNFLPNNDWEALFPAGQGARRAAWYRDQGGPRGAAFVAYVLTDLQDSPVDVANFFTGDSGPFGLFTQHGEPKKTFYAFKAFQMLRETPHRVEATGTQPGRLTLAAGLDEHKKELTVLVSNVRDDEPDHTLVLDGLPWKSTTGATVHRLDGSHDLTAESVEVPPSGPIRLKVNAPPATVVVVRFRGE